MGKLGEGLRDYNLILRALKPICVRIVQWLGAGDTADGTLVGPGSSQPRDTVEKTVYGRIRS
jgi:hypothetical protein